MDSVLSLVDLVERSRKPLFGKIQPILMPKILLELKDEFGLDFRTPVCDGQYDVQIHRIETQFGERTIYGIQIWDNDEIARAMACCGSPLNCVNAHPIVGGMVTRDFTEAVEWYAGAIDYINKNGIN